MVLNKIVKRSIIVAAVFLLHVGCTTVIYAQTLPATLTVAWDPNPANENITGYDLILDGVVTAISNVPNAANKISATISVSAYGHHDMSIVAKNSSLSCDVSGQCAPFSIQTSPPLLAGFTLSAPPSAAKNVKATKP